MCIQKVLWQHGKLTIERDLQSNNRPGLSARLQLPSGDRISLSSMTLQAKNVVFALHPDHNLQDSSKGQEGAETDHSK